MNTSTEADDTHPALKQKAADALAWWKKAIENQIKRGIERKEIKANVNPTQMAIVIMSLIEGSIMQAKLTGKSIPLKAAMDFLERQILDMKA